MPSLGAQIDKMYLLDQEIHKSERVTKDLKEKRTKLESRLLHDFGNEDIDGCKGKRGQAGIQKTEFPSIKDRRLLDRYVAKHKAFDLFQNRINSKAWKDRIENGEKVPGISIYERIRISIRKRGGK